MADDTAARRKATPVFSGVLAYFPDALEEVAKLSKIGNDQHNPGQPLHWAKEKSTDEPDALVRHLLDYARDRSRDELAADADGVPHLAKVAWRALALLQRACDKRVNATPAVAACDVSPRGRRISAATQMSLAPGAWEILTVWEGNLAPNKKPGAIIQLKDVARVHELTRPRHGREYAWLLDETWVTSVREVE